MKKRQFIILGSSFVIFLMLVFWVGSNKKMEKKKGKEKSNIKYYPVVKVENKDQQVNLISYGQISSYKSIDINSEVSGKLVRGNIELKPGVKFRQGQLIAFVENNEVWYNLAARKGSYINMVANILPDIKFDFPNEYSKWEKYMKSIKLNEDIPDLPKWNSEKEKVLLATKGVLAEYFSIKSLEANTQKYKIIAPFDGTILESYIDVGTNVNMGSRIIKIIHTGNYEVKVPMSMADLERLKEQKEVIISNSDGKEIGVGLMTRSTDVVNQQTQSIDVYFRIQPLEGEKLYNGMYINVSMKGDEIKDAVLLPRRSVNRGSVYVVADSSLVSKNIKVERYEGDSVYVSGLTNGDFVVLNSVQTVVDSIKVVGVEK
ncbi:MAG: HlyD family efflux transporter periplasmic adaptor subunit [Crocinitomicaceae bacterium]|nr:HlyD family efflux transporter periplasmic adaptor subunit [Crocinitomicaceae bacterium]